MIRAVPALNLQDSRNVDGVPHAAGEVEEQASFVDEEQEGHDQDGNNNEDGEEVEPGGRVRVGLPILLWEDGLSLTPVFIEDVVLLAEASPIVAKGPRNRWARPLVRAGFSKRKTAYTLESPIPEAEAVADATDAKTVLAEASFGEPVTIPARRAALLSERDETKCGVSSSQREGWQHNP